MDIEGNKNGHRQSLIHSAICEEIPDAGLPGAFPYFRDDFGPDVEGVKLEDDFVPCRCVFTE